MSEENDLMHVLLMCFLSEETQHKFVNVMVYFIQKSVRA